MSGLDAGLAAGIDSPPGLAVLDARERELDGPGLRAWATHHCDARRAAFVSRSYRHPYALLAWHSRRVGVDLEVVESLDRGFAESIATFEERAALAGGFDDPALVASLWSGKEALAKALGDALAYDPRHLSSPLIWSGGRSGPWRAAALADLPPGHVGWLCWEALPS